ncbi:Uncharacterised protein [Citrobacter werkmanii]|uniref:Uncharacterized protein n=1 Tax=Citrobacter werkmanii TaxID=67827 RepID=A0A9N8CTV4_9ENTR|nr:hypothetical protein AF42_02239 [Citrobacter freundii MGH 56]KMV84949.1 hypothetical protein HMPREF9688_05307 [Klebsiella oxytoca 10-5244]QDI11134.1 hypothetical protein electrica_05151 [Klebsiella electrica]CAB5580430.1 Uncharacterised protein [Citrobacter werkmanii]CAF2835487.1 hypothetical protein AI2929V1_5029 [Klebsiella pneumoniae]BBQ86360.1 hypothetical protein WP3W18E02_P10570 [Klebsiella sp. WP3-W18-ESBL-02]BBR23340.1 hypothetical protein WP3S18E05_P10570 [Klebsiella sp. WP3-S18-E
MLCLLLFLSCNSIYFTQYTVTFSWWLKSFELRQIMQT